MLTEGEELTDTEGLPLGLGDAEGLAETETEGETLGLAEILAD